MTLRFTFTLTWTEIILVFMRSYSHSWVRTKDFTLRLCERDIRKVTIDSTRSLMYPQNSLSVYGLCCVMFLSEWQEIQFQKLFPVPKPVPYLVLVISFACSRELLLPVIIRFSPYWYAFFQRLCTHHLSLLKLTQGRIGYRYFNTNITPHIDELEITIRATAK